MRALLLCTMAVCLGILLLPGCVSTPPMITPQETITVMTYNILNGAGVDPVFEKWAADHGYPGNRLSRILEVIKAVDPDILGIQEAAGWDKGTPSIARRIAKELGMKCFLGKCIYPESGFNHVVLLTKFNIKGAVDYQRNFTRAALHAEVIVSQQQSIHVFVAHLIPPGLQPHYKPPHLRKVISSEVQRRELSFLLRKMKPYKNCPTILIGDMNFLATDKLGNVLAEAGYRLAANGGVDHIWVSPMLTSNVRPVSLPRELMLGASDHFPVVVEIDIYSQQRT